MTEGSIAPPGLSALEASILEISSLTEAATLLFKYASLSDKTLAETTRGCPPFECFPDNASNI
jgi:hypothetical protein